MNNNKLTSEIVLHVLNRLGVDNNQLTNYYNSIMVSDYITDHNINFITEDDNEISNKSWSCKISFQDKEFRLLLADCSCNEQEFALITSFTGLPEYACYYSWTDLELITIKCYLNEQWSETTTYMQASFLAGMEQLKELSLPWVKNEKTDDLQEKILKFIKLQNGEI